MLVDNLNEIHTAARLFIDKIADKRVVAFRGKMGAGKTTFIKAVCNELEVHDPVNSPTFAIINEYFSEKLAQPIYHFDCYRLVTSDDALRIGIDDYFDSGCLCFIEWPENIENLLPDDTMFVEIEEKENGTREIKILS